MNNPIQQRECLKTQLIEILGEPLPDKEPPTLNMEWCWERGDKHFDVVVYYDGEIVVFDSDSGDIGVFSDLTIYQCLAFATQYNQSTQFEKYL